MPKQEKQVDEVKLSKYGLKLCEEIQYVLPYISNMRVQKRLIKALNDYLKAFQKLGGKIE